MKNLVVIDFDGTLLPYESLRKFLFRTLKKYPIQIGLLLILRRLRIISSAEMKNKLTLFLEKKQGFEKKLKQFAQELSVDCSKQLLEKIKTWQLQNCEVLVLSASPHIYLQHLQAFLDCKVQGSFRSERGEFIHLFGKHKVAYIETKYPKTQYHYLYAVSDHKSDIVLLQQFEKYDLISAGVYA